MSFMVKPFESRAEMTASAVEYITACINDAVLKNDKAGVLLSGGSSPRPIYEALSQIDLAWDKITIGLVDERWVAPDTPGSNQTFIAQTLLQNKAAAATFIPMKTAHVSADAGASSVSRDYAKAFDPIDICIMGMGTDGHTASWFPQAKDLERAMDIHGQDKVCAFDATGCPVAGEQTERITLTLPAVLSARHIILLIAGAEKQAVFEAAQSDAKSVFEAPVKALMNAGTKLTVFWGA